MTDLTKEKNSKEHEKRRSIRVLRDEKGRILPGYTANPWGRPKRSWSIKDKFWQRFENNPKELTDFLDSLIKKYPGLVWQMLEGTPHQSVRFGAEEETITKMEEIMRALQNPIKKND